MSDYFGDYLDSPFLDSDMELDEAMARHPSAWNGPPRQMTPCPVCGRGMYSVRYLESVPGGSYPVCGACRKDFQKHNHTEEMRRSV